jgi:glucose-6-phosphate 1-dehydrogenase
VTVRAVAPETAGQVPTAPAESCTVIIFGATGDLARRKLIPALYGLRCFAEFSYAKSLSSDLPDAYATLLLDAMRGDGTLFTRRDEVEAAWRIITPIEEAWAGLPSPRFPNYAAGSDGPAAARALMRGRAQHAWCAIEPTARPRSPGT